MAKRGIVLVTVRDGDTIVHQETRSKWNAALKAGVDAVGRIAREEQTTYARGPMIKGWTSRNPGDETGNHLTESWISSRTGRMLTVRVEVTKSQSDANMSRGMTRTKVNGEWVRTSKEYLEQTRTSAAADKARERAKHYGVFPYTPDTSLRGEDVKSDPSRGYVVRDANPETGRGTYAPYSHVTAVRIFKSRAAAEKVADTMTFGKGSGTQYEGVWDANRTRVRTHPRRTPSGRSTRVAAHQRRTPPPKRLGTRTLVLPAGLTHQQAWNAVPSSAGDFRGMKYNRGTGKTRIT